MGRISFVPEASDFISFNDIQPSGSSRCIYLIKPGERCKLYRGKDESRRMSELHRQIMESSAKPIFLNLLMEYAQSNCCTWRKSQHNHRIKDRGLLVPLAQRWSDEIQEQATLRLGAERLTTSRLKQGEIVGRACDSPATSDLDQSDDRSTTTNNSSHLATSSGTTKASNINASAHQAILSSEDDPELACDSNENHAHFELRTQQATISGQITYQACLSEFRPYAQEIHYTQSVYHKLMNRLQYKDPHSGSVYIFDRRSSPGFVKIGWTTRNVRARLEDFSECGYKPNLLFSSEVSCARRVETLVHHELIKERRKERMCKGPECSASHEEWFEIDKNKAEDILREWVYFINEAQPYGLDGKLKAGWVRVVDRIKSRKGIITASELVKYYNSTLTNVARGEKGSASSSEPINTGSDTRDPEGLTQSKTQKDQPESNLPLRMRQGCGIESLNRKPPTLAVPITEKELAPEEIPLPLSPIIGPARL